MDKLRPANPPRAFPGGADGSTAPAELHKLRCDENTDMEMLTFKHLKEDIVAYEHDLELCAKHLAEQDLTRPEERTLEIRILDLGHQLRYAQHRIEALRLPHHQPAREMGTRRGSAFSSGSDYKPQAAAKRSAADDGPVMAKRPRAEVAAEAVDERGEDSSQNWDASTIKRLGFWQCRLCTSEKYKLAGEGRLPSAPCKWPLRDIAKMMTHFFDMHREHEPQERCMELGNALDINRESHDSALLPVCWATDHFFASRRPLRVLAQKDTRSEGGGRPRHG